MKRVKLAVMAVIAAGTIALAGCSGEADGAQGGGEPSGGTLTIGNLQPALSFDPGQLDTGRQVQYWQAVYDTLLNYTPDGTIEPNLATEWKWNDDKTVLSLTLRDDVVFSDGAAFTAEAVKANLEHLAQGTGVSTYMVKAVESVEVIDDTHVDIHLTAPDPAFEYYLCLVAGVMASPAALGSEDIQAMPVGSGPYLLDASQTITGSEYVFTRNPDYWNAAAFPYDTVVIKSMEDLTARVNALKSGQVNGTEADTTVLAEAEASNLQVGRNPISWRGLIIFDRAGEMVPALADVRVREALNYAIDREAILENIWAGAGTVSTQIFNAKSPAHVDELDSAYPYDPAKAKKLLAEAGYPNGFEVTMPELAGDLAIPVLTQQLADVGITVNWEKVPTEDAAAALMEGRFALANFGSSSGHPWRDIYKMVSPDGAWNPMHSTAPELDALLKKIPTLDGDEQDKAYQDVSRFLVENAWFAVVNFTDNVFLSDQSTNVEQQSGSVVPYLRNFAPAQ